MCFGANRDIEVIGEKSEPRKRSAFMSQQLNDDKSEYINSAFLLVFVYTKKIH